MLASFSPEESASVRACVCACACFSKVFLDWVKSRAHVSDGCSVMWRRCCRGLVPVVQVWMRACSTAVVLTRSGSLFPRTGCRADTRRHQQTHAYRCILPITWIAATLKVPLLFSSQFRFKICVATIDWSSCSYMFIYRKDGKIWMKLFRHGHRWVQW